MWRGGDSAVPCPYDFLEVLYEDKEGAAAMCEEEEADEGDENVDQPEESDDEEDIDTSLAQSVAGERNSPVRSRSPIAPMAEYSEPSGRAVVICDVSDDIDDNRMTSPESDQPDAEEVFLTPDAHVVYEKEKESVPNKWRDSEGRALACRGLFSGKRGHAGSGMQGRRRGRGRERGQGRRGRDSLKKDRCELGNPLTEVYITDDDVPPELRELVMDVVKNRVRRAQEERDRAKRATKKNRRKEDDKSEDEDVFHDAEDGIPFLEGDDLCFEWSPMETFRSEEETFKPELTGSVKHHPFAYSAFRSYWGDEILETIAKETNAHAATITSAAFQTSWYDTNAHEILCLFAFWMMLGIIRMPTIKSCFSMDPLIKTEIFRTIFTFHRYVDLSRALQFIEVSSNEDDRDAGANVERLMPIITHLNSKFKENYILSQNICVDESLTLWKGKLNIRQYVRSKAAKFGIKTFELCESTTGYLWSFIVDTGTFHTQEDNPSPSTLRKSASVVINLIKPLLNKGYRLFVDNRFNSPLLARYLKRNGTDCVGTLGINRTDVPPLLMHAPLRHGQFLARHSGDVCLMAWQDRKRIHTISTCHGTATALSTVPSKSPKTSRPLPFKPQVVLDCNKHMGGVHIKDQMLSPYLLERKRCSKWYMKFFKRLVNCSILNARILVQSSTQSPQDHLDFRLRLVDSILDRHLSHCPTTRQGSGPPRKTIVKYTPSRIQPQSDINHQTHWPIHVEQKEADSNRNRHSRNRCFVCSKQGRRNRKTTIKCESCDVPLCPSGCFKDFHTKAVT